MSTQKTGYLEIPGMKGLFGVREDGAAIQAGGINYTMPGSAGTLPLLDSSGNQTFTGSILSGAGTGTVTTAATTTATEYGDGFWHITKLTMTAFAIGTSDDNASLAIGAKFYSLPAGAYVIEGAEILGGVTAAVSVTAQTPEVGIGTTVGTGVIANLSTTMEDIVDGGANGLIGGSNTAPDVAGTTFAKGTIATSKGGIYIAASGGKARDLFLNVAVAWADVTAPGAVTFTGTITVKWRKLT